MRIKMFVIALSTLIFLGLAFLLFWPQPIEGTPLGAFLANELASLFDPLNANRGATIRALEQWMNFVVFIPFAGLLFLVFQRNSWLWSLTISMTMSVVAELAQFFLLLSRVSSFEDFLLNTAGAFVGVGLAWLFSRLYKAHQK